MVTLSCVVILMALAWYSHRQLNMARQTTTENIATRNTLIQHTRVIRQDIWLARNALAKFQIDPDLIDDPAEIHHVINDAIEKTQQLLKHPIVTQMDSDISLRLEQSLSDFDKTISMLVQARTDVMKQFPSLSIAYTDMQPRHRTVMTQLMLAIDAAETAERDNSRQAKEIHKLLNNIQSAWLQMVASFRMYMLNRLNAFHEDVLPQQLTDIDEYMHLIRKKLAQLEILDRQGKLDFEIQEIIQPIRPAVNEWNVYLQQVLAINSQDEWRRDNIVYQQDVEPLLNLITELLGKLDDIIEESGQQDIDAMTRQARNQITQFWIVVVLAVLSLGLGFILLVRLVLSPITQVTHALKQEACGNSEFILPSILTNETRDLVDAFTEMREQVHYRQDALEFYALHDSLTGLANRKLLSERLNQAIHNAHQEHSHLALLILDLNRFKEVNDTLGHQIGDQILLEAGKRLTQLLRGADTVARLGGDEFAIVLNSANRHHSIDVANKILSIFEQVFTINDINLFLGASIGIAIYPMDGDNAQALIQHADIAMYTAKRNRLGYVLYDPLQDTSSIGKLSLLSELRNAINNRQIELVYQPIINIRKNTIISAEALLRWHSHSFTNIETSEIIMLAEHTGLINRMTQQLIEKGIEALTRLHHEHFDINLSFNISVYNLQDTELFNWLKNILSKNPYAAQHMMLEVTESVMMTDPYQTVAKLEELQKTGVRFAVDDYGTGFSSLSYLKKLPIDYIKIDRSFVTDMLNDENDAVIVRSTIDMAHNLGMKVIAEGIETGDALELLWILDCDEGQGYYIQRPCSLDHLISWMKKNRVFPLKAVQ